MLSGIAATKYVAEKLLSTSIEHILDSSFKYLARIRVPGLTRFHFSELRSKVSHMPFIYHGLDSEVLTDFVDIDMTALDPNLMRRPAQAFEMTYQQRIANHKHVMLFGRGGVGKTTYLRRTILDVIASKGRSRLFNQDVLVPFYVPLKAIDNSEELPILNYLLRDNSLLSGHNVKKLASLAENRKLMLCLDGYDEIPFASADMTKSPVMKELSLLTGSLHPLSADLPTEEHSKFYQEVAYCRVWMTSRLEFYHLNRFQIGQKALALEITGVPAQNRARLVKRIFDRYRKQLDSVGVDVSHENFIQRIERSGRDELVSLSFNPLFLTVMAYIYVNRVIEEKKYDVGLVQNVIDLINECVNLMLVDLDRFRARDLPAAHRDGLLCRRSEWIQEKHEFLRYFAFQALRQAQPTFGAEYIRAQALTFFRNTRRFQQADNILRSIEKPSSLPGFVDQLIFCGIFVQVSESASGISLDFPHRKFREVLGAEHLAKMDRPESALQEFIDKPNLEESLYGIFESTPLKDTVVSLLLSKATQVDDKRIGLALSNCLDRGAPQGYDPTDQLWQFFFSSLQDHKRFRIPRRVLRHVRPSSDVLVKLVDVLRRSIDGGDCHRLALSSELIHYCFGNKALVEVLEVHLTERQIRDEVFPVLVYEYLSAQSSVSPALLRSLSSSRQRVLDVGVALATCVAREKERHHMATLRGLVDMADNSVVVILFYLAGQVDPSVIPALCEKAALPAYHEAAAWLCHKWGQACSTKPAGVITLQAIEEAVRVAPTHGEDRQRLLRLLSSIRGLVYFEEDSVLRTTRTGAAESRASSEETIPAAVRDAIIRESRLRAETYEDVKNQLRDLCYTSPSLPAFFEGEA